MSKVASGIELNSFLDLQPVPVKLPSSIALHYVRAGRGPTLIFIHGAMGDWRSWAPQWDSFTSRFDCIAYSRRYSFPNTNPMNTRKHNAIVDAEDLERLMDALDIDRAILVGSSYGGFTALAMAVRAPARVMAVVSVEAPMMRYAQMTSNGAEIARQFLEEAALPRKKSIRKGGRCRRCDNPHWRNSWQKARRSAAENAGAPHAKCGCRAKPRSIG